VDVRSLRALSLAFLTVFVIVTAGTGFIIFRATHEAIVQIVDKRIITESYQISDAAVPMSRLQLSTRIQNFIRDRNTGDVGVELSEVDGRHIAGNYRFSRRPPPGLSSLDASLHIKGLTQGRAFVRDIGDGMVLTTFAETEPVDNFNAARRNIYIAGFGTIIALVIGTLFIFVRMIGSRIAAQNMTAEAIIDGDMRRRVPVSGNDNEFDEQARIFNRMLDRIGELMAHLANVSNDIAHDLRTPLSRLRNQLTLIERQVNDPALRREVESAIVQSDNILAMFTAILRIVEIEGGDRRAAFQPLDLGALAERTGGMMEPVAADTGHLLTVSRGSEATVSGDPQLLAQALINLVENAQHHTPPGSHIRIATAIESGQAMLTVSDDGPGIDGHLRQQALRRFGRIDKSRTRPGHGLGLPLVDAIVRLHRGELMLGDAGASAGSGLLVSIRIPLIDEKEGSA
jgi:signal transduction histidine kinase